MLNDERVTNAISHTPGAMSQIDACRSHTRIILLTALAFTAFTLLGAEGHAQPPEAQRQFRLTPPEVKTAPSRIPTDVGSSGNSAVKEVVIYGDPSKPGLYTVLLKVGPNARIPAHYHPDDRVATVISGDCYFGYGDKFDQAKLKRLPPGSIYSEPANQKHFAMTHGPVVVEITGHGPSGVIYTKAGAPPKRESKALSMPLTF